MDEDVLLGRAQRVVEQALRRGAEEAECYFEAGSSVDVAIERGRIAAASTSNAVGAAVRILKHGRLGFAYFTDHREAPPAIERAIESARLAPTRPYTFPEAARTTRLPGRWSKGVAALDVDEAASRARDLLQGAAEATRAVMAGGGVGFATSFVAIANSRGLGVADRSTSAGVDCSLVLEDGERSVTASEGHASHRPDGDAREVGRLAGERVESLRRPKEHTKSGAFDVVLRPEATSELVVGLAVSAATGDDAMRGRTSWTGKKGERVAAQSFFLRDDATLPAAVGAVPFDDEGTPTRRLGIVERGELKRFLFDSWDASFHGQRPTPSAVRGSFKARPATGTHHVTAGSSKSRSLEALVASIDDGFLVDQMLGAHTANEATGEFSVTSPGVWRIRKGAVEHPVRQIALSGSLDTLLRGFMGSSREVKVFDGAALPHMAFEGVRISV